MTDREQIQSITNEIYNISCPTFDIGNRVGNTGYIDFIDTTNFSEPFRKGSDKYDRKFISFRALIEYTNGERKETFMTLFQRYIEHDYLWMGAGRNVHLFSTEGGATIHQLRLVFKLLKEGSVDITDDIYDNCRLTPYKFSWNKMDNNRPKKISLVSNNQKEKLEDVMKDLEEKVNPKSVADGISQLATAIQTNDSSILLAPMAQGAKEFEERVGRKMTYAEMRAMWG